MSERVRVLITGINGFVGSHLEEAAHRRGWLVHGTVRSARSDLKNLQALSPGQERKIHPCDLTDYHAVARLIQDVQPDLVFHLAAQSFVPASWTAPRQTLDANLIGTLHLLEACRAKAPTDARIQIAGTSEEYGRVEPEECPITEAQPLRPLSPYGVSKAAADLLAQQYAASYGLHTVVTRAFNHTGPRRGASFAESDWARQIAQAEADGKPCLLRHGNLDAVRDYTDVRDIVQGYIRILLNCEPGDVYNLCSGAEQSPTMKQVLDMLRAKARVPVSVIAEVARMRPSDVPRLVGDSTRARKDFGWKPEVKLERTFQDLLDYWRAEVGAPSSPRREIVT